MNKIKFGIDGWWGKIANDFTLHNVALVADGIARWLNNQFRDTSVVLGCDTRFGGEMFMEAVAKIIASKGIQVYLSESEVTSPMISLGVVKLKAQCGIVITAGHNTSDYNGIKLKGPYGGPLLHSDVENIQNLISSDYSFDLEMLNWNYLLEQRKIQYINLESIYLKHLHDHFDIDKLRSGKMKLGFDAMCGGSQRVIKKLLPDIKLFHCSNNPSFNNIKPDPKERNLHEIIEHIERFKDIDCALAVDADGDRMAMIDEEGRYVNSHQLFLIVIHYLVKYEQQSGKVLAGFSMSSAVERLCAHYGLEVERTKIGFSNITNKMLREDILCGAQETGGITLGNYLPERDALWMGIQIWEWLSESGKKISDLLNEVESITSKFAFDQTELFFNRNERSKIIDKCKDGSFTDFGKNLVTKVEFIDGYKFFIGDSEWVLIRPSTRHPLIRLYAEAETPQRVAELIQSVKIKLEDEFK